LTITIRWVGQPGRLKFRRITWEKREALQTTLYTVIGVEVWSNPERQKGEAATLEERTDIATFQTEEECLLAVLALNDGGAWKVAGNVLTGD